MLNVLERIKSWKYLMDHGCLDDFKGYTPEEIEAYSSALGDVLTEFSESLKNG